MSLLAPSRSPLFILIEAPGAEIAAGSRSMVVQRADLRLRNLEMVVCSTRVSQALIQFRQIHVQLNAVKRSLGGALR